MNPIRPLWAVFLAFAMTPLAACVPLLPVVGRSAQIIDEYSASVAISAYGYSRSEGDGSSDHWRTSVFLSVDAPISRRLDARVSLFGFPLAETGLFQAEATLRYQVLGVLPGYSDWGWSPILTFEVGGGGGILGLDNDSYAHTFLGVAFTMKDEQFAPYLVYRQYFGEEDDDLRFRMSTVHLGLEVDGLISLASYESFFIECFAGWPNAGSVTYSTGGINAGYRFFF